MPIYPYECARGHYFEVWQSIKDEPLTCCRYEEDGSFCPAEVRRIIAPTNGFVMDPTGIYQPIPGKDKYGKQNEEKITRKEFDRRDRALRDEMLETAKRGPRLDVEPKKQSTWF